MPDDFARDHFGETDDNVHRIGAVPRTPEEKRARIRAGQTKPQQVASGILVALLFTAVAGALFRLNVWLWLGR